jgi:hypothetical protein
MRPSEAQNGIVMIAKFLSGALVLLLVLVACAGTLFMANATPAVTPISPADLADSATPYVVKLHARWCPVCMLTKAEWAEIETTYAGRAKLLVFDSTSAATVEQSRIEAARLGLEGLWERYRGASGIVVVLDGRTREVVTELAGNRPFDDYRDAIDAVLGAR